MEPVHTLASAWDRTPPRLVLPRRLLKDLIVSQQIGIGSRVLDAGCGSGELVRFLDYLSIDAEGLDDSAEAIAAARRAAPHRRFYLAHPEDGVPLAEHQFDLVLVRELNLYRHDLLEPKLRRATAHLLACLRPGGSLAFVLREEGTDRAAAFHGPRCVTQHVASFPLSPQVTFFEDDALERRPLRRLLSRVPRSGYFLVVSQVPRSPLSRSGWLQHGAQGFSNGTACCPWARSAPPPADSLRRAA